MTTQEVETTVSPEARQKLDQVREVFADAPDMARTALEDVIREAEAKGPASTPATHTETAGRIGLRQGEVSELTVIMPIDPAGVARLRAALTLVEGAGVTNRVGTLHNLRFVFFDNDTRLLFATAYDGDWDVYIDDFATKIPAYMDLLFSAVPGWPGIHDPSVKDFIVKYQIPAERWSVACPDLTVVESHRLQRLGQAVDKFLDEIST